jgi:nucleoside-diphosphate-sugar epimerase
VGAEVIAVGRDRDAVAAALGPRRVEIVESDLTSQLPTGWLSALQPDVVFNLAGYGVDRKERDEHLARRLNHEVVAAVASEVATLGATDWPFARLVHVGSALEYGTTEGVLSEESPAAATTLYGITKLAGTQAVVRAAREEGVRGVVGRLFTVYGPGEHAGRLLPSILAAAASGSLLPLSDGEQRRDFTYVEDAVEGLLRLAVSAVAAGEVINVATGVMQRVRDFVTVAAAICGIPNEKLQFGALPRLQEEMRQSGVSVARLRQLTGWLPTPDLETGIRRAIARSTE